MFLPASSYHEDVPALGGSLQVTAVFPRAWHLQHPLGWIVTVLAGKYDGPLTVCLDRPSLSGLGIRPGMPAALSGGVLGVGPHRIELKGAAVWSPRDRGGVTQVAAVRADLRAIEESLRAARPGLAGLARADEAVRGLRHALLADEAARAGVSAADLVGLGPGLTPSGDDLLCGLLVALSAFERRGLTPAVAASRTEGEAGRRETEQQSPRETVRGATMARTGSVAQAFRPPPGWMPPLERRAKALGYGPFALLPTGKTSLPLSQGRGAGAGAPDREAGGVRDSTAPGTMREALYSTILEAAAIRTTALSYTLLAYAGHGVAMQPLLDVVWSLGTGPARAGVNAVLGVGHTSGRDMLAGVCLAGAALGWEEAGGLALAGAA